MMTLTPLAGTLLLLYNQANSQQLNASSQYGTCVKGIDPADNNYGLLSDRP